MFLAIITLKTAPLRCTVDFNFFYTVKNKASILIVADLFNDFGNKGQLEPRYYHSPSNSNNTAAR